MKPKINPYLLLFIILYTFSFNYISAQENYIVRDIEFFGNDSISEGNILDQMTHYPTSWFSDVILFEDPFLFSKDIFERDRIRIIEYYQRNGFLNAEITNVNLNADSEGKTVEIGIEISENIPIKINNVELKNKGEEKLSFLTNLLSSLSLKKGVRFTEDLLNKDQNIILDSSMNNGYPYANVEFDLDLDTLTNSVNISWMLDEGKYAKFGDASFEGNERTEESLLKQKLRFKSEEKNMAN